MTTHDKAWHEDQIRHGWVMPTAPWWKRLPVIRHVRAIGCGPRVFMAAHGWGNIGIGKGTVAPFDAWVCYGMARGWEGKE